MSLPVALQFYTVREDAERDFFGTLKAIRALGYDGVEFAGLFGNDPAKIAAYCKEINLCPISAHVPLAELTADTEKTVSAYATVGCKYIAIPYVTPEYRPGAEKFGEMLESIRVIGKVCREHGIQLLYHNHDFEFVKIDGETGLDVMYKSVSAELLATELDTCWVNVGGEVPADYIRKYTSRAPVVHLKDFYMTGKLPKHLYALIGIEDEKKDEEPSSFEFRPVGHGMQDIPAILKASEDAGASWVVVEQDEPSQGLSRMESAEASLKYLKSVGY